MSAANDNNAAQKQIAALRDTLRHHDHLYYALNTPEISDERYDALFRELKNLEAAHPELITPDSPTQRVGERPLASFEHVRHAIPMLSIDNTYSPAELREFDARVRRLLGDETYEYVVDPKIDGVAVSLRYEDGLLTLGATRGDGEVGDDITQNLRTIRSIPLRLAGTDWPRVLEVRGEVYWPRPDFAAFNAARVAAGEQPFANPRNATAGTLKQHDSRSLEGRGLAFQCHGFGVIEPPPRASTHSALLAEIRSWGVPVSPHVRRCRDIDAVVAFVAEWEAQRRTLDYDTDGLVAKIEQFDQRERLGSTSNSPRWCIAYKYAAEQAQSQVLSVDLQVGKLGTITPVANLKPVPLAGTTVKRASLHNFDQVRRLDLHVGDTVTVEKAGEIIPQVVAVDASRRPQNAEPIHPPEKCPECGGSVVQDQGGVYYRCLNPACPAQIVERLRFFCGRDQMDIEALGEVVIGRLVMAGFLRSYADIYRLPERAAELPSIVVSEQQRMIKGERRIIPMTLGRQRTQTILDGIEASKRQPLARLLAALGIGHVGVTTAEELANGFGTMDTILAASERTIREVLSKRKENTADDLGREFARKLSRFLRSTEGQRAVAKLRNDLPFAEQVLALNIPLGRQKVTEIRINALERVFGSIRALADASEAEIAEALEEERMVARAVHRFFHATGGDGIVRELAALGLNMVQPRTSSRAALPLADKTVVVTGSFGQFKRKDLEERIRALGGKVGSSVSASTNFVVQGTSPGSKLEKARTLGIEVIDESEFIHRFGLQ